MARNKTHTLPAAKLNKVVDDVIAQLWSSEAFIEIVTGMVAQGIAMEAGNSKPKRKKAKQSQNKKKRTR